MTTAFSEVFPSAIRSGCFFYFAQCIFRQVQANGLQTVDFLCRQRVSLFIRCLAAVAFVPVLLMMLSSISLFWLMPDTLIVRRKWWTIFEDILIGRPDCREIRKQPMFPINSWNVFDGVLESLPRTNSSVEGWQNGFQWSSMCSHPSVWRLIEHLQTDEGLQRFSKTQLLAG